MKQTNQRLMIFLIMLTSIPMAFALDEYAPSMPSMVQKLNTTISYVQLSIPLYMFAAGISVLLWGPLSDRFGRRKIILISMPIFFVGSLFSIFASDIVTLLIGRVLQGIGLGTCAFIGSAIMSDIFEGTTLNRVMSYFSATYSVVPIVAPVVGGFLQKMYGWRANFIFILLLIFLFYLLFFFKLSETHTPTEQHKLNFRQILKNYLTVISNRNYLLAVLCMISVWSLTIAFSIIAPFLLQNRLGVSAFHYGLLALFIGLGYTLGSILSSILVKHINPDLLIKAGIILALIATGCLLIFSLAGFINIWTIIIFTFITLIGTAVVYPNTAAIAVAANPSLAGTAMGLLVALLVFGVALVTLALTFLSATSVFTLVGTFLVLLILCLFAYSFMNKEKLL